MIKHEHYPSGHWHLLSITQADDLEKLGNKRRERVIKDKGKWIIGKANRGFRNMVGAHVFFERTNDGPFWKYILSLETSDITIRDVAGLEIREKQEGLG